MPSESCRSLEARWLGFLEASLTKELYKDLDIVSPEYGLSRQVADRRTGIRRVNLILVSERSLNDRLQNHPESEVCGIPAMFHIWDISRLFRQRSSRNHKEPLDLDFETQFGEGIPCLPAHLSSDAYRFRQPSCRSNAAPGPLDADEVMTACLANANEGLAFNARKVGKQFEGRGSEWNGFSSGLGARQSQHAKLQVDIVPSQLQNFGEPSASGVEPPCKLR